MKTRSEGRRLGVPPRPTVPMSTDLSPQRLDAIVAETHRLERPRGRRLAYLDLGDPAGRPLFAFHGNPGSRLEFIAWDQAAHARGLRLLAPDRPGVGASDPWPTWRALDWPGEVEALAEHLGLRSFAVAGISGGGPALYATAHALPDRVEACFALAAATPLYRDRDAVAQLSTIDRVFAALGTRLPEWLMRLPFAILGWQARRAKTGEALTKLLGDAISEPDRAASSQPDLGRLILRDIHESYRQGAAGPTHDALLIYRDWGLSLAEIRVPTFLRHGLEDRLLPPLFSRFARDSIPGAELCEVPGQGHYVHMAEPEATLDWIVERLPDR